jgi:hypothetical protein
VIAIQRFKFMIDDYRNVRVQVKPGEREFDRVAAPRQHGGMATALIINGDEIDDMVVEEEFDAIKDHHERLGDVVCCDRDVEFRDRAKSNVINRFLLHQESSKKFGTVEAGEIDEAVAQLKEDHGGEEKFYENVGMSADQEDDIRAKVATTLSVDRILREHVGEDVEPSDEDLRQFYKDHQADFMTDEEVHAIHIYLEPGDQADADEKYAVLRETRQQLLAGADFEAKAKELCREDHQLDLGFFKRGGLGIMEVEILTFSMNIGEISPVMPTHFGYHIFKLLDRKASEPIPFEEVKEKIQERFSNEQRESKINGLVDSLKNKATIEEIEPEPDPDYAEA